ncbi:hypothetical protein AAMO2058_001715000 [Amorphochlora amoebiformis]
MVRRVEVTVPSERTEELVDYLAACRDKIHGLAINRAERTSIVTFRCKDKHVRNVVDSLDSHNVGVTWGIIDVLAVTMTKPRIAVKKLSEKSEVSIFKAKAYSIKERQTIEEIYEVVDSGIHLTFDYMAFTVVAAIIAGVGLLTDSSVTVVASMLVSPLMGPILGVTFGFLIKDYKMMIKSIRNEILGVVLTFLTGVIIASFTLVSSRQQSITFEMSSRGEYLSLFTGAVVASPSGVGVALSVANTNINSLVGVAISAALLPPIVNSGLLLTLAFDSSVTSKPEEKTYYRMAGVSMCLFLMNWVLIFTFANLTFILKGLDRKPFDRGTVWDDEAFSTHTSRHNTMHGSPLTVKTGGTMQSVGARIRESKRAKKSDVSLGDSKA